MKIAPGSLVGITKMNYFLKKSGMYPSLAVLLLCVLVKGSSGFPFGNEETQSNIAKGYKAHLGEFKYQVALMYQISERYYPSQFCGGSIISKTHVLSAAHCTTWKIKKIPIRRENVIVRAGVIDYNDEINSQNRRIRSWVRHPSDDIVLINVNYPFIFTALVQPIALPTEIPQQSATRCVISGWGGHGTGIKRDQFLKKAINTVSGHYQGPIIELKTSALTSGWGCKGDSGGPLVCNGKLVGVIQYFKSYTFDEEKDDPTFCSNLRSGFGNVYYYIPWLKQNGFVRY